MVPAEASGLPLAEEVEIQCTGPASDQQGLMELASIVAEWIYRKCGIACSAAAGEGGGPGRPAPASTGGAAPLLLRRARLNLTPAPPDDPPPALGDGTSAEEYVLSLPTSEPGAAVVEAATLAGAARGAGAFFPCWVTGGALQLACTAHFEAPQLAALVVPALVAPAAMAPRVAGVCGRA